jgi:agmatinase
MSDFDPNAAALPDAGVFGLPNTPDQAQVVLIPVPWEATTSYGGGTSEGPGAVLSASKQVDLYDLQTGRPWKQGIAMLEDPAEVRRWNEEARRLAEPIIEAGGMIEGEQMERALEQVNALCGKMNDWVYDRAQEWLGKRKLVGAVGGDHGISFGNIRAHAERYPGMGILHLDAHADLRDAYEGFTWSHASIMRNVMDRIPGVSKLVQVAIRDLCDEEREYTDDSKGRIVAWYDPDLAERRFEGAPWNRLVDEMVAGLPQDVYLSFDIDGLDPVLCPHTGTPVPGGLSFHEAVALVSGVVRSGRRIVGFDLTEVSPDPEGGEWDGNVGARLLYKMIGFALLSAKNAVSS